MATPKPDSSWNTVAQERIDLQDAPLEGHYPTPRALWPQTAHAPLVLNFRTGSASFSSLRKAPHTEASLRSEFTSLAIALDSLGKGPHIEQGGRPETHKDRSIAYLDAIAMGERASKRKDFLGDSNKASSCGMFVRNLYKLIGVKIPSYSSEYQSGDVMRVEQEFAMDKKVKAMVFPGTTWDPVLDYNGDPVLDKNGRPVIKPAVPKPGDAIYWNKGKDHRHVQVVIGVMDDPQGAYVRHTGKDGKTRQYETVYYDVIQGGAGKTEGRFPDDGDCMAIKRGSVHFKTNEWTANIGGNILPISYGWIDIYKLAEFCDDDPMIIPDRQNMW